MSLKTFHIVFIVFSVLLAFGVAVWAFQSYAGNGNTMMIVAGIASAVIGIGLIIYGVKFLKKLKHVSYI